MIRAIRPNAMARDDASLISGWNISPNVTYVAQLNPGASACGVLLYSEDQTAIIASGAGLVGTDQTVILHPYFGQTIGMVDADLGWHLLVTTTGTEAPRTIRIGPAVDLPDEIHPIYADDDLAVVRATAGVDDHAHYIDDVSVTCPLGLGTGLGDVVSVPVDGAAVIGQVESITWTGTPDGMSEQATVRRYVAIAPESYVEQTPITPPVVAGDTGTTDAATTTSGNVLTNDDAGLAVVAVNGLTAGVGVAVDGSDGGAFVIDADGSWTFDPDGDFAALEGSETAETSVTYHASDGASEAMATLTVTVSPGGAPELWAPEGITSLLWLDAADSATITLNGSTVSQWADKSGRGLLYTQATAANQPARETNAVSFDRGDWLASATSIQPVASGQLHVFAVVNRTVGAGGSLMCDRVTGASTVLQMMSSGLYYIGTNGANNETNTQISSTDFTASGGAVCQYRYSHVPGSRMGFALHGVPKTVLTGTQYQPTGAAGSRIGRREGAVASFWPGKIYEIIAVESLASALEIEGYLAHKWDALLDVTTLVSELPADHKYKITPPTV